MRKSWMKWSYLTILALASCQQRDLSEQVLTGNLALEIQASIAGETLSRTTTQQDGHTVFAQGDKIGFLCQKRVHLLYGLWERVLGSRPLLCSGRTRRMIMILCILSIYRGCRAYKCPDARFEYSRRETGQHW